ncbi:MAG: hypothetical protein IK032_03940 [Bacteroidales bacterium]|nr:hypothetical protein [Bacteroidales bacterium]
MKKYRNIFIALFVAATSVLAVSCLKDEETYKNERGNNASRGTIVLPYTLTDPTYDVVLSYRDNYNWSHLLTLNATNPATLPNTIGSSHPTAGGGVYTEKMDTIDSRTFDHTLTIHYDNVPVGAHSIILHCPFVVNKGNKSYHDYYLHIRVPVIKLDTIITHQFEEAGAGYDYTFDFTVPDYK